MEKKRLTAQPIFQPSAIADLLPLMARIADKRMTQWALKGKPIDMRQGSIDLTLEIVTEALFGQGIDRLPATFHESLEAIFQVLASWVENPFLCRCGFLLRVTSTLSER